MGLDAGELGAFRDRLRVQRRERIAEVREALLASDEERYLDLAGAVHDRAEEAVGDLLVDLEIEAVDRQVNEVRDIEAALGRLAAGTFGMCVDCEGEIEARRLTAYPTVKRCHACQTQYERQKRSSGGPTL